MVGNPCDPEDFCHIPSRQHFFFFALVLLWKLIEWMIHGCKSRLRVRLTWIQNRKPLWLLSRRLQWIFFLISLFFYHFGLRQIASRRPSTHTPVCQAAAWATSLAFHLILLFLFFHILIINVALPTAGIHYLWETRAAPLQSPFFFFLKSSKWWAKCREREGAIQWLGQVLLPRALRALSAGLIVGTCADGGPSDCLLRINPATGTLFSAGIPLRTKRPEYKDAF